MSRHGQCRCGLILTFHRSPHGYKMRCPSCGAVVRLRTRHKRGKPERAQAALPGEKPPPGQFDVELLPGPESPARARTRPGRKNLVIALVAAVAGALLLAGAAGLAWWLLG